MSMSRGVSTVQLALFAAASLYSPGAATHPCPTFNRVLSHLFGRRAGRPFAGAAYGAPGMFDLSRECERETAVNALIEMARHGDYNPAQKDELAARIAGDLGVDYSEIRRL